MPAGPVRRAALVALVMGLVAPAALPAAAPAKPGQLVLFDAPSELANDAQRAATLDEIRGLGAGAVRVMLAWADAAPAPGRRTRPRFDATDPRAYRWPVDPIVDAARARGLRVFLTVSSPVPRWATSGGRDTVTAPSARDFGRFMTAAGRHFGGRVDAWLVWNEPNHARYLLPQRTRGKLRSPLLYRALYLAARAGLRRAGRSRDTVVAGELAPSSRAAGVPPLPFLRAMLCLDRRFARTSRRCPRSLPADGFGIHPYAIAGDPLARGRDIDQVTIGSLDRLTRALDGAARAHAVPARLAVYVTEYGVQSFPDHLLGVPPLQAAAARSMAERTAWRNGRVTCFSQYLMRDDTDVSGFQTGLRFADGRRKPAYAAFRLPLVAERRGRRVALWGIVRPARGRTIVRLEQSRRGARWAVRATVRTDRRGAWRVTLPAGGRGPWRVAWAAPDGATFRGPPTAVTGRAA